MLDFRIEEIPSTIPVCTRSLVNTSETMGLKFQLLPKRDGY